MKQQKNLKKRIFDIIQIGNTSDIPSRLFDIVIVAVILINILVTFLLTFDAVSGAQGVLQKIEFVTIAIFTVEYGLRVWTAEYLFPEKKRLQATAKYLLSFLGIIDLLTILPYFLPFFFPSGAVAFRMFRVVRILHLFKINANYDAFNVIADVLKEKKNQLISSVFLILILLMASSLCMYDLEHAAQPENFTNAFSGIWWSVSTLLTVGYGDIYPITVGGRMMAIVIAFLGVGVVAVPTGIISAGFVEYYGKIKSGLVNKERTSVTTLCYLEKDNQYLMLHRTKKEQDINKDKYIGVGGHVEHGESPEDCVLREVKEETGFDMTNFKLRGLLTFVIDDMDEYTFLYTCDEFTGKQKADCDEGDLVWVDKDKLDTLSLWEGDKIFFDLLNTRQDFFSLKLYYVNDKLIGTELN